MNIFGHCFETTIYFDQDRINFNQFNIVSDAALGRLSQIEVITSNHDFSTSPRLEFGPKYHLVEYCWTKFVRWCKERDLTAKRTRLTEDEIMTRKPRQTRKVQYDILVRKKEERRRLQTPIASIKKSTSSSTNEISPDAIASDMEGDNKRKRNDNDSNDDKNDNKVKKKRATKKK